MLLTQIHQRRMRSISLVATNLWCICFVQKILPLYGPLKSKRLASCDFVHFRDFYLSYSLLLGRHKKTYRLKLALNHRPHEISPKFAGSTKHYHTQNKWNKNQFVTIIYDDGGASVRLLIRWSIIFL